MPCLRSRSPVFDSIFRGRGPVSEMVQLREEDLKPNIFHKLLFMYSDNLDVTPLEALHMRNLGQKYKVQPLIEQRGREALLGEGISFENAAETYETAEKYGILDVKQEAIDLIVRSLEHLLQDPQLLAAKEATLMELLQRNDFRVKEVDLFRFVVRDAIQWGPEASTDRARVPQVLSPLLSKVRYTNMTPTEFTTVVMPTKLIPADEALDIFSYFNGDDSTRAALMNTFKYNTSCRCGKLGEMFDFYETDQSIEVHHQPKEPLLCEGTTPLLESMRFKVRGLTAMGRTCPRSMYKPHGKLQLKSIQVQWPLLHSREVDKKPASISVAMFEKLPGENDFKSKFCVYLVDCKVSCVLNVLVQPPMDITDEAEYYIGIADELFHSKPFAPKYRYSSDNLPFGSNLKPNIGGGCLNHVEISKIRRNDCVRAPWNTPDYKRIHVIRGMQLEFAHDNPTD